MPHSHPLGHLYRIRNQFFKTGRLQYLQTGIRIIQRMCCSPGKTPVPHQRCFNPILGKKGSSAIRKRISVRFEKPIRVGLKRLISAASEATIPAVPVCQAEISGKPLLFEGNRRGSHRNSVSFCRREFSFFSICFSVLFCSLLFAGSTRCA